MTLKFKGVIGVFFAILGMYIDFFPGFLIIGLCSGFSAQYFS